MTKPVYRKILLAVDGGDSARRAIREAVALAALAHACVHAVYVVHKWGLAPYSGYFDPDALGKVLNEDGRLALEEVRRAMADHEVLGSVEICETLGKSDSIAECLQRCAKMQEADLIVMGTHGRHGVSRAVLGSVAEGLLRLSSCPVLVVHG
ncbi:universal stress protein [Paraburkholderia lycopersici]|uniref:Universal stress protein n=1 Tax=Paraburkholderia lycopersici TaxID=416944 RepID=A0A1G6SLE4_9BURK|nr:universal stress protein [Paraburkholderia lycopersici]SDD16936.1 Nucleotide-binding universal stress protein, UspA family [Paraburkholderia lycopersici]